MYYFFLKKMLAVLVLFFSFVFAGTAYTEELRGRIVGVTDGDTVTLLDADKVTHTVRLGNIDAPETSCHQRTPSTQADECVEKGQPFGKAAKKSLSSLVFNRDVMVKLLPGLSYNRSVGVIYVGGSDINLEQVRRGYAWHYMQYAKKQQSQGEIADYQIAEKEARAKRLGLWADKDPVAPWGFRHREE